MPNFDFSHLKKYNIDTKEWSLIGIIKKQFPQIICLAGHLYILGSLDDKIGSVQKIFLNQKFSKWQIIASMCYPRQHPAICIYSNRIYVFGGKNNGVLLNTGEFFDPRIGTWNLLSCHMNQGRSASTACVYNDCAYLIGGIGYGLRVLDVCEIYDFKTDSFRVMTPMNRGRLGHGASIWDDSIYVLGGNIRSENYSVFDIKTATWKNFPMMQNLSTYAGAVTLSDMIYVFGHPQSLEENKGIQFQFDPRLKKFDDILGKENGLIPYSVCVDDSLESMT